MRLGLLTGGGDAPGLNAVIRAVVKTARRHFQDDVFGIRDGYEGLLTPDGVVPLEMDDVRGILPRGGTVLGTANRGNPFARRVVENGVERIVDVSDEVVGRIVELGLDALIVVGGDGTMHISHELVQKGCPIIGVPKTIDNDIGGTDVSFGYDTAVNVAMEAIDRLHTTAEAHHRVMVVELMGRDAGFIALRAGISGGADVILIPELPFRYDAICDTIKGRAAGGRHFSILAVAEGARPRDGDQVYVEQGDGSHLPRLGGIGQDVAETVARLTGMETRVTVLGHLQRGGSPSAFDRWLATRFGAAAVRLAHEGRFGRMVAVQGTRIVDVSLAEALAVPKRVDPGCDAIQTARGMGISLGVGEG